MEAAVRSPRWLSYTTVVFSLSFLLPGLLLVFGPAETILAIYASFGLEGISQGVADALVNAFTGLQARNIAIALLTLLVAFRDIRVVLLLWSLRLLVEVADLAIALGQGDAGRALLPVIGAFIAVEILVLTLGLRAYRRRAGEMSAATLPAVPAGEAR